MPDAESAASRLERTFEEVRRTRMQDVPILNSSLRVQAVGTRAFGETWLSVLVTPWFINVMLLPGSDVEAGRWASLELGASVGHVLPAGRFAFIVGEEAALGRFQMCSLFSPVLEFADQETAVAAAEAALAALFEPPKDEAPAVEESFMGKLSRGELPPELETKDAPEEADDRPPAAPSRRELLTGSFGSEV